MTEIPDHLLERTRSRRQALGLPVSDGASGAVASAGAPAAGGGGGGGAAPATLPKGPVAPSGPTTLAASVPKALPPFLLAAQRRQRIPMWALPVVLILPLWAFLYAGTLEPAPSRTLTLAQAGAGLYNGSAGCAACHGAGGGGGVGPKLSEARSSAPSPIRWSMSAG